VDLAKQPELARADDVFALPTLVRRSPTPARRVIGDLSDTDRVLASLEMTARNRT
jgi:circadian clock protein KaiB